VHDWHDPENAIYRRIIVAVTHRRYV